jgi:hypothetical protein
MASAESGPGFGGRQHREKGTWLFNKDKRWELPGGDRVHLFTQQEED